MFDNMDPSDKEGTPMLETIHEAQQAVHEAAALLREAIRHRDRLLERAA